MQRIEHTSAEKRALIVNLVKRLESAGAKRSTSIAAAAYNLGYHVSTIRRYLKGSDMPNPRTARIHSIIDRAYDLGTQSVKLSFDQTEHQLNTLRAEALELIESK